MLMVFKNNIGIDKWAEEGINIIQSALRSTLLWTTEKQFQHTLSNQKMSP